MPENSTRRLTHGAMMVAIFTVLLAMSTYVPMMYIIAIWVLPLPLAWFSAKYALSSSIAATIVAIALSFIVGGGFAALPAAFIFAVIGLVIGVMIRQKKSKLAMFLATSGTTLVTFGIVYTLFAKLMNMNILQMGLDSFEQSMKLSRKMMVQANLSDAQMKQFDSQFDMMEKMVTYTMPSVIVFCVLTITFIILSINLPLLKRFKLDVPKFKPFRYMQLPRSILWYYLIVLAVSLFVKPEEGTYFYVAILNLSLVLSMLLALQGLSLIIYFLHEKNMPKGVAVIAVIIAIPMMQFVSLIGLIDLGFNVRAFITGETKK
jgi:uncharacterized protein YybS (DUF2232 family)